MHDNFVNSYYFKLSYLRIWNVKKSVWILTLNHRGKGIFLSVTLNALQGKHENQNNINASVDDKRKNMHSIEWSFDIFLVHGIS